VEAVSEGFGPPFWAPLEPILAGLGTESFGMH
jgi:hypothetical protein